MFPEWELPFPRVRASSREPSEFHMELATSAITHAACPSWGSPGGDQKSLDGVQEQVPGNRRWGH